MSLSLIQSWKALIHIIKAALNELGGLQSRLGPITVPELLKNSLTTPLHWIGTQSPIIPGLITYRAFVFLTGNPQMTRRGQINDRRAECVEIKIKRERFDPFDFHAPLDTFSWSRWCATQTVSTKRWQCACFWFPWKKNNHCSIC